MLKEILPTVILPSWTILGFYRGVKQYNNKYKKECNRYENNPKYYPKPQYFYAQNIPYGLFGLLMYINPLTVPLVMVKEIYRLEVNVRNLNEEKEKEGYNDIL
jgi:hypothetical protein